MVARTYTYDMLKEMIKHSMWHAWKLDHNYDIIVRDLRVGRSDRRYRFRRIKEACDPDRFVFAGRVT